MLNFIKLSVLLISASFFIVPQKQLNLNKEKEFLTKGDTINWKLLAEIKFVKKKHKDYGMVDFPIVNDKLKSKSNKKVLLSGFIVPIDNISYAISKNVFASCFFCGKAGPESIAGLKFKGGKTPKLKTDQYVTVEGTFKYNEIDADNWIYNLEDVVIVKGY